MLRHGLGVALRGVTVHVEPLFTIAAKLAPGHNKSSERSWRMKREYIWYMIPGKSEVNWQEFRTLLSQRAPF